jgi:pSer/pThr/pTyr-binding forkhead associated (FHA) protein
VTRENIELLWESCGARSPLILDVEHSGTRLVNSVKLDFPFTAIGRTATNDVVLDHSQVSRRHAYLQLIDGQIFCVDFSSRTGTHWPGGTNSGWVRHGQSLQIGPFVIRPQELTRHENAARSSFGDSNDPLHSFRTEQDPYSEFTIHFTQGVREQSAWQVRRVLTLVGSSPKCKLQLVDPRVSRYHCSLLRTPLGTWVIDLMGRGGVRVNDARVRFARLYDGDELQIGIVKVRIECDTLRSPTIVQSRPLTDRSDDFVGAGDSESSDSLGSSTNLPGNVKPGQGLASPARAIHPGLALQAPGSAPGPYANLMKAPRMPSVPSVVDQDNMMSVLLYHFGQMQQQMAEQFHQAVMTMVQMFSTFHRDQMELVREELNRLHDLNQEIVSIQSELARQHPPRLPQAHPASTPRVTTQRSSTVSVGVTSESRPSQERSSSAPVGTRADRGLDSVDESASRAIITEELEQNQSQAQEGRAEVPGVTSPVSVTGRQPSSSQRADATRLGDEVSRGAGIDSNRPPGEDAHAWLWQRMEAIRAEQQTLWQKILTTVRAKVTGNAAE